MAYGSLTSLLSSCPLAVMWCLLLMFKVDSTEVQPTHSGQTIRLMEGPDRCTGFLEVKSDQSWRSVCESQFTLQNAVDACRELGCGFPHKNSGVSPSRSPNDKNDQCNTYLTCKSLPEAPLMTIFSTFSMFTRLGYVTEGHRFVISCHVSSPFKIRSFQLKIYTRPLLKWTQPAVENSAHFLFPAAEIHHQVYYYCSYNLDFSPEIFSEEARSYVNIIDATYVRLVDERSRCLGRLEVEHQYEWRPLSLHQSWSLKVAAVVCRQLGCGSAVRTNKIETSHVPVWQFYSDCDGSESTLFDCGTVREWVSTSTVEVLCSDILAPPSITVLTQKTFKDEKDPLTMYLGHSFFNCSVEPRFPGGHFSLVFTGVNHSYSLQDTAVNHSDSHTAIFKISVAPRNAGNYSCIYYNTVSGQDFSFESQSLAITVENYELDDVQLDDGVLRDNDTPVCAGKLLMSKRSQMKMVTAESSVWDIRHASIVCRQLDCGEAVSTSMIELPSVTPVWRFFSHCNGSETALVQCGDISEWYSSTAVRVVCAGKA